MKLIIVCEFSDVVRLSCEKQLGTVRINGSLFGLMHYPSGRAWCPCLALYNYLGPALLA